MTLPEDIAVDQQMCSCKTWFVQL